MKKYEDGIIEENAPELYFIELYREFHEDGSEKLVGGLREGKKHGIFREYDIQGNIVNGFIYEEGNKVAEGIKPLACFVVMRMIPPFRSMASKALLIRLRKTCCISDTDARIGGM